MLTPETPSIRVSVIYAEPARVFQVQLVLPIGATMADAIAQCGIRRTRPDIDIREDGLGVFARRAKFDTVLREGDRVEIYRPLRVDPKEARRQRATRR